MLVAQIKFRDGFFGCLLIRRFNGPKILGALSDNRDAPGSQLGRGVFLWPHAARILQIVAPIVALKHLRDFLAPGMLN